MVNVYLLLGSNLGDRKGFLQQAIALIEEEIAPVITKSGVYETQSWGISSAPDYLNQVITLQTELNALKILSDILAIELKLGRKREEKWGSRTIDIDILLYGNDIINDPGLIVPHPEMHKRRFTLEPLAEIASLVIHPLLNKTIKELKSELIDELIVKKLYF